jgi:hypothetical protein
VTRGNDLFLETLTKLGDTLGSLFGHKKSQELISDFYRSLGIRQSGTIALNRAIAEQENQGNMQKLSEKILANLGSLQGTLPEVPTVKERKAAESAGFTNVREFYSQPGELRIATPSRTEGIFSTKGIQSEYPTFEATGVNPEMALLIDRYVKQWTGESPGLSEKLARVQANVRNIPLSMFWGERPPVNNLMDLKMWALTTEPEKLSPLYKTEGGTLSISPGNIANVNYNIAKKTGAGTGLGMPKPTIQFVKDAQGNEHRFGTIDPYFDPKTGVYRPSMAIEEGGTRVTGNTYRFPMAGGNKTVVTAHYLPDGNVYIERILSMKPPKEGLSWGGQLQDKQILTKDQADAYINRVKEETAGQGSLDNYYTGPAEKKLNLGIIPYDQHLAYLNVTHETKGGTRVSGKTITVSKNLNPNTIDAIRNMSSTVMPSVGDIVTLESDPNMPGKITTDLKNLQQKYTTGKKLLKANPDNTLIRQELVNIEDQMVEIIVALKSKVSE